jgi:hypothetical protein
MGHGLGPEASRRASTAGVVLWKRVCVLRDAFNALQVFLRRAPSTA